MRISGWSSDVCSSDLPDIRLAIDLCDDRVTPHCGHEFAHHAAIFMRWLIDGDSLDPGEDTFAIPHRDRRLQRLFLEPFSKVGRSEEHTSELQSLTRISYAVFCLKKKQQHTHHIHPTTHNDYTHTRTLSHKKTLHQRT